MKFGGAISLKKVICDPNEVVPDMLSGMELACSKYVRLVEGTGIVLRKDAPVKGKVAVISGGGSGHEPAHAGYVGKGMLDAACAGNVFSSPPMDQIVRAIKEVDGGKGVFMVIKNYTGDIINFQLAAEEASNAGIQVESVVVKDDIAVTDAVNTTGRRGVAGTVFVHKVVGAMAERGGSLEEVKEVAERAVKNIRTIGVALSPCTIPAVGRPNFEVEEGYMEVGIGIHGEPGVKRIPIADAGTLAKMFVDALVDDLPFRSDDEIAVMVNGMGATPLMELYLFYGKVFPLLKARGIKVYKAFVGEFMTSLEMAGLSLTLFKLDEELKSLLDYPADTPALTIS